MVSEEEYVQTINSLAGGFKDLGHVVQTQEKRLERLEKDKPEELPWYLAKNPKQMQEQLEKMGVFEKEEAGLQDNIDNAFRMFTQVNERGELIQGLSGAHGPASLMEMYQTMDIRGVVWNYGLGWLSALKGGWNIETNAGEKKAQDFIDGLIKERVDVAKASPEAIADFFDKENKMTHNYLIKDRDLQYRLDRTEGEYKSFYNPPRTKKVYSTLVFNKADKTVGVIENPISKNSIGTQFVEIDQSEEVESGQPARPLPTKLQDKYWA